MNLAQLFIRSPALMLTWALVWFFASPCWSSPDEDPDGLKAFNELSGEPWVKANAEEAAKHFAKWKLAHGEERNREAELLRFFAWRGEQPEMLDQLIADGRLLETGVKVPDKVETVSVTVKYRVPVDPGKWGEAPVWRRITSSAFEVWTPHEGRLFDTKGNVIASANPTRDDSNGREWFGAFLPDGHWITTELHEGDGRIYIFNHKGRCTHEIKSGELLKDAPKEMLIVPWARSTKDGKTWLVRVGSEEGLGESLLEPDVTWRKLKKTESLWQLCQPRQLGVRLSGGITFFEVESDDGRMVMSSQQASHGVGCGNPLYEIVESSSHTDSKPALGTIPSSGHSFGFWPRSHATHVFNGARTWCFDASRHYQGWISGERVGDAADHQSMIFRLKDGRCVTVSPRLRATHVQRFQLADGQLLMPLELHPDIGLGIFCTDVPTGPNETQHMTTHELAMVRGAMQLIVGKWNPKEGN